MPALRCRWTPGPLTLTPSVLLISACVAISCSLRENDSYPDGEVFPPGLIAPSAMPLADYEGEVLFPWLQRRAYADLGWVHDPGVRDTGPLVSGQYHGTHPAVRVHYSPEVVDWLENDRQGELPDGAMIVKEMFHPPAAFYGELAADPWFGEHPDAYEELLVQLLTGWTIMVKDRGGNSTDGWFWAGPGVQGDLSTEEWLAKNVDDDSHVRYAGFGIGTCIRCHASAANENTFSSLSNLGPAYGDEPALTFLVDESWRSPDFLGDAYETAKAFLEEHDVPGTEALLAKFDLPPDLRPWPLVGEPRILSEEHAPALETTFPATRLVPNPAFVANFPRGDGLASATTEEFTLPMQWSDHVYPGPVADRDGADSADEYISASNCMGCHGGLGGAPSGLSMFVKTGPNYGDGYNVSEFGEWRWSPMGLAGRDPIFHAQLESEMILLLENAGALTGTKPDPKNPLVGSVEENQKALTNTCLSCHGAMGQRQLAIDAHAGRTLPSGEPLQPDFNPDYFYATEALTEEEFRVATSQNALPAPPRTERPVPNAKYEYEAEGDFYGYHAYGELAREGIGCAVCHRIAAPGSTDAGKVRREEFYELARAGGDWLPEEDARLWKDNFLFFLAETTTGQLERSSADELYGPFEDVIEGPMEHALGITPKVAPPMESGLNEAAAEPTPYTSDSNMCGTCHAINLPNIGETEDEYPVLTAIENNPAFEKYPHSIEQATYLEWLNSDFGPGESNERGPDFQSCQDCHMPNRFAVSDGSVSVDPLTSQIASIQDSAYPAAEHSLPPEELEVPHRANYRRHELVGLNAFMVAMAQQFPSVLGLPLEDYETSATTGPNLAIDAMVLSAQEERVVTLDVGEPAVSNGTLTTEVAVTNRTGHRFPSGVAFRRAFIEFVVLDGERNVLWASGQTNRAGLITRTDGETVLVTELLDTKANPDDAIAQYQPNHQVITDDTQVQIYEELITDADDEFTTSFVHRVGHVKDNRLLPRGWIPAAEFAQVDPGTGVPAQGEVLYQFMLATNPEGASVVGEPKRDPNGRAFEPDPDYTASPSDGADRLTYAIPLEAIDGKPTSVRVTVYSQSFMPAWFHQRFEIADRAKRAGLATPETDRLYHIASHLELESTPMKDWKLPIRSVTREVSR